MEEEPKKYLTTLGSNGKAAGDLGRRYFLNLETDSVYGSVENGCLVGALHRCLLDLWDDCHHRILLHYFYPKTKNIFLFSEFVQMAMMTMTTTTFLFDKMIRVSSVISPCRASCV